VLVVDDDPTVSDVVRRYLERDGFVVESAADGAATLAAAAARPPDLVVLDLGLPGVDGLEVCRQLRSHGPVPIVMLTARGSETDRILGLELGADDYVTKPFSPRELVARIKAVLRRTAGVGAAAEAPRQVGVVTLDPGRRRVQADGVEVALTSTEFDLLAHLMQRPGRVFTREELLASVWGYAAHAGTRTVDVHVAQVRAKLDEASPLARDVIRTVRGVGYTADTAEP
jgi:DNA-binding response OmpR family regulator